MRFANFVARGNDVVEQDDGFIFPLLIDPIVGTSQAVQFGTRSVHFEIVFNHQRERHGIIRDELGRGSFQHLQLTLSPFVFADKITQLGIFETGLVAQRFFLTALVDLAIEQCGFPHLILVEIDVAKFQLEFGLVL